MDALKRKFALCSNSFEVTRDLAFRVQYLGCVVNPDPGVAGIKRAVAAINKNQTKVTKQDKKEVYWLKVSEMGIWFLAHKNTVEDSFMELPNISYSTWSHEDTDLFAFNHHISKDRVECHAVKCENHRAAHELSLELYSTFRGAYFSKLRENRQKRRESLEVEASEANRQVVEDLRKVRKPCIQSQNGLVNGSKGNARCENGRAEKK